MSDEWWKDFFDSDYLRLWGGAVSAEESDRQAAGLWDLLGLRSGARVLDAPCGYGRIARRLAMRGARVVGLDLSETLLQEAERQRGELGDDVLRYVCRDLRLPFPEDGFDAAINIFSSLGYGSEDEDLTILRNLGKAVRPGGLVLVETNHRDAAVAVLSRGMKPALRLEDGTLIIEEPVLDPVRGRVEAAWHWSGPDGSGTKRASLRVYTATELARLMERAGLKFRSAHKGCSPEPFEAKGPDMGGRIALLAERAGN